MTTPIDSGETEAREAVRLTWNQRRGLENLNRFPDGASARDLADPHFSYPYLRAATSRSVIMALAAKGLAECYDARSPMRYRITDAGRALLDKMEGR